MATSLVEPPDSILTNYKIYPWITSTCVQRPLFIGPMGGCNRLVCLYIDCKRRDKKWNLKSTWHPKTKIFELKLCVLKNWRNWFCNLTFFAIINWLVIACCLKIQSLCIIKKVILNELSVVTTTYDAIQSDFKRTKNGN